MSDDLMDRDIPESDSDLLRQITGISAHDEEGEFQPLPIAIVEQYWAWRKLGDRADIRPQPNDLVTMVRLARDEGVNPETQTEKNQKNVVWLFNQNRIERGQPIEFYHRKERHPGTMMGVSSDGMAIIFDEKNEERKIKAENVFLVNAAAV